jgi:hypothetical protein
LIRVGVEKNELVDVSRWGLKVGVWEGSKTTDIWEVGKPTFLF